MSIVSFNRSENERDRCSRAHFGDKLATVGPLWRGLSSDLSPTSPAREGSPLLRNILKTYSHPVKRAF